MRPYCSRCFTHDPSPAQAETGDTIYWFKLSGDDEDELCTIGLDSEGEVTPMFIGVTDKDFEFDGSFKILCPDCAAMEAELLEESLDEDWDAEDVDDFLD